MIELAKDGNVFLLRMDAGENRFSPEFVDRFDAALTEVEQADAPKALVTVGSGKFYSNGLDLEYMTGEGRSRAGDYLASVLGLMKRLLTFPMVTVSAMNGHAFGAGAQVALAHDFRLIRSDRGWFCMPEADMRVSLHPGMTSIIRARLAPQVAHEVIVTARRYSGDEAVAAGIAHEAVSEAELLPRALKRAQEEAGKAHPVLSTLKRDLYPQVLEAMDERLSGM